MKVSCILEGKPRPVVTWSKGGVKLVTDNRIKDFNVSSTWYLTIVNLRRGDAGLYTCEATNCVGSVTSRPGTLDVYCKFPGYSLPLFLKLLYCTLSIVRPTVFLWCITYINKCEVRSGLSLLLVSPLIYH